MAYNIGDHNDKTFTLQVSGFAAGGGPIWRKVTGHEQDMLKVASNYSRDRPAIVSDYATTRNPAFSGSIRNFGYPRATIEGFNLRRFIMFDASLEPGSTFFAVSPGSISGRAGELQRACINTVTFYITSTGYTIGGEDVTDTAMDNHWIRVSHTDEADIGGNFSMMVRLGVAEDSFRMSDSAFSFPNRAIIDGATVENGGGREFYSPGGHIHILAGSRSIREVRIRPVTSSDGLATYALDITYFAFFTAPKSTFGFVPYAAPESAVPEILTTVSDTGVELSQWRVFPEETGLSIISVPVISSGPVIDGATDLSSAIAGQNELLSTRLDNLNSDVKRISNLEAGTNIDVPIGDSTIINGNIYRNVGDKAFKFSAVAEEVTEKAVVDAMSSDGKTPLFEKRGGAVVKDESGNEFVISTEDLGGKDVDPATAEKATWVDKGAPVKSYTAVAGKWIADREPADLSGRIADLETKPWVKDAEVKAVSSYTIPPMYWAGGPASMDLSGSKMLRNGQVHTVAENERILNPYPGTHQFTQAFGAAERGKSYISRTALPEKDTASTARVLYRNSAFGTIVEVVLSHNGTAWVSNAGAVTLDNGWAVMSLPVTFSATLDTTMLSWFTPGRVQLTGLIESGKEAYSKTTSGFDLTDRETRETMNIKSASALVDIDALKSKDAALQSGVDSALSPWLAAKTYADRDMAVDAGIIYRSIVADNKGFRPSSSPAQWEDTSKVVQADIKANRAPTSADVHPIGKIWADTSYGDKDPLIYLSRGAGNWEAQNRITLRAIRVYVSGYASSAMFFDNCDIFDATGAVYPRSSFVVGARSSNMVTGASPGATYTGQSFIPSVKNEVAWFELEPASGAVLNGFSGGAANFRVGVGSTGVASVAIHYSNGGLRTYPAAGAQMDRATFLSAVSAPFPVGASIDGKNQHILTAVEATDSASSVSGLITGQVLSRLVDPYAKSADLVVEVDRAKAAEKANADAIAALPTAPVASQYYGAPVVDFAELRGITAPKVSEKRFIIDQNKSYMFRKVYINTWGGSAAYDGTGVWFEDPSTHVPNTGWIVLLSVTNYQRRLFGDVFKSLQFEFSDPDDPAIWTNFALYDFEANFPNNPVFGGPTNITNVAMPSGGRTVTVAITNLPNSTVQIYVANTALTKGGMIRKVVINGMVVDRIVPDFSLFPTTPVKEVSTVNVAPAGSYDFATAMPRDGVYYFISSALPGSASTAWKLINPPAGATISLDGIARSFSGTPSGYNFFDTEIVIGVREGVKFTFITSGLDNYENMRWSTKRTITQAFFGTSDKLQGLTPARWMALTEGSIHWKQSDTGVIFSTVIASWNSNVDPKTVKTDFQITDITYEAADGTSALAVGTNALPTGTHIASWRNGVLLIQKV